MRRLALGLALSLTLALAAAASACGSNQQSGFNPASGDGGGNPVDGSLAGDSGGHLIGDDGGSIVTGYCDGGGSPVSGGTITAAGGPNIVVKGQATTVQLTASSGGTAIKGTWTTSNTTVGTVSSTGVFHTSGYVGGSVDVILIACPTQLKITLNVSVDILDNSGMLSSGDQTSLMGGGPSNPNFNFLYPYDGTVFPQGLQAPVLQFGDGKTVAGTANGTYLKLTTTNFSYQQFGAGGTPVQVKIPQMVWDGATQSSGGTSPITASVSEEVGTTVSGPLTEKWTIAPASLRGFIYYSTYKSPLLPNNPTTNTGGGILRVAPGSNAVVVESGCIVCHSISANGSVLSAASGPDLSNPMSSDTVNITAASPTPTPRSPSDPGQQFAFAALSPTGAFALTNGNPALAPPNEPHGFNGAYQSQLVDTSTGMAVNSPSLTQLVKAAQTPAFSPDGTLVAFVNGDMAPGSTPLSVMSFDGMSVFSNLHVLRQETETTTNACNASVGWTPNPAPPSPPTNFPAPCSPQPKTTAWPSFLPDSKGLIYHSGDSFDSAGYNLNGGNLEQPPQYAELRLIDLSGNVKTLNTLNGRGASGTSTLPYGEAVDNNMNYEPNVMPLAVGGYYWVVFTSRRSYGNTIAPGRATTTQPYDEPAQDPFGSNAGPSPRKKLWVAAIDLNYGSSSDADPSHPAFFLSGQELESANMRAFAALAPCEANGDMCEVGSDCCNGYCRQTGNDANGAPILACVPPPAGCSNVDEPCKTAKDCCNPQDLCINGLCTAPSIQ
jgi:hypothetical protein